MAYTIFISFVCRLYDLCQISRGRMWEKPQPNSKAYGESAFIDTLRPHCGEYVATAESAKTTAQTYTNSQPAYEMSILLCSWSAPSLCLWSGPSEKDWRISADATNSFDHVFYICLIWFNWLKTSILYLCTSIELGWRLYYWLVVLARRKTAQRVRRAIWKGMPNRYNAFPLIFNFIGD